MNRTNSRPIVIRTIVVAVILAVGALTAGAKPAWCQAEEEPRGVPNFGRVTDMLYRGGQPASEGFSALQAMGIGIVVNFRDEREEMTTEKRQVESLGIKYVEIPWSGLDKPSNIQVAQFLDLIRANPKAKIFVHCKRGADRTGVMVAAYRIAVEHEPVAQAVSEMHQFHYAGFWLPQLKRYVESFPEVLQKDARFTVYNSVQSPVTAAAATVAVAPMVSLSVAP
jgi:tyrosine-protein phosphatase SIW14